MTSSLGQADVDALLHDGSPDARARIATKVAREFERDELTPQERRFAEDIIRVLSRDAAERVRVALSEQVKESTRLPHDVAQALALDIDAVAVPILHASSVLTDGDLIAIVRASGAQKQVAIAGRARVAAGVAAALVEADQPTALATLVANDGAEVAEPLLHRVLQRHPDAVAEPMARRAVLPLSVMERLVAAATTRVRDILVQRHDLPDALASDLVLEVREQVTVDLLSPRSPAEEAAELVAHLKRTGRLTPSLIMRALCTGDMNFVEAAFAAMAAVPLHNAQLLIHDSGTYGFQAIYKHCGMPPALFPLFKIGLAVARETAFDGGEHDRERHRHRTIERILTQYDAIGADELEFLLGKLRPANAAGRTSGAHSAIS